MKFSIREWQLPAEGLTLKLSQKGAELRFRANTSDIRIDVVITQVQEDMARLKILVNGNLIESKAVCFREF